MSQVEILEISNLARRIDKLISLCDTLRTENLQLSNELSILQNNHHTLYEKTDLARAKVDSLLDKLKGIETKDESRKDDDSN